MMEGEEGEDIGRYLRAIPSIADSQQEGDDVTVESINFTKPTNKREVSCLSFDTYEVTSVVPGKQWGACTLLLGLATMASALAAFIGAGPQVLKHHQKTVVTQTLPVSLPANYRHFLDTNDEGRNNEDRVAVVWDIPGDGDVLQHILSRCLHLVAAGGASDDKRQTNAGNEPLEIFEHKHGRFLNCFTGSQEGIDRIVQTNMVSSGLADVVYAPLIYEIGPIFTEKHPAKMVALFHDPVQRVASVFHIFKQKNPAFQDTTIEEFFRTKMGAAHNNWMTRELSNCGMDELNEECLRAAVEVVEKKCVVGLTSDLDASLENIFDQFGWQRQGKCSERFMPGRGVDRLYTDLVQPGSAEYELIEENNMYDIALYEAAKAVFSSYQ